MGEPGGDYRLEIVRQRLVRRIVAPEGGVGALVHSIVRHDVVAHAFVARGDLAIEALAVLARETTLLEGLGEFQRGRDDDVERGRLQRLDEPLREARGEAVAGPAVLQPPDLHAEEPRLARAAGGSAQFGLGSLVGEVTRGIDVAVAHPRGQRDAPAPAGFHGHGLGLRQIARVALRRHDDGAVGEEVAVERQELGAQRAFRDQRAKARAVDEQVARDSLPALADQRGDVAAVGKLDLGHLCLAVDDAARRRPVAQEGAELVGVEVVAVAGREGETGGGVRALALARQPRGEEPVVGQRRHIEPAPRQHGVVGEAGFGVQVHRAGERVEVACEPRPLAPAGKADAELEGGVAGRHPFGLGDAEMVEQCLQLRGRALAHADDADLRAFNDGDRSAPAMVQQAGGDPARAAAAQHDDGGWFPSAHRTGCNRMASPPPGARWKVCSSPARTSKLS